MPRESFVWDENTEKVLKDLEKEFNVSSKKALLRRLIALGRAVVPFLDKDKCIRVSKPGTKKTKLLALAD